MHATIAFYLLAVGGPVAPELPSAPEFIDVPLYVGATAPNAMQDLQWKLRLQRYPLPRVPTLDMREPRMASNNGGNSRRSAPPSDPYAQQRRQAQAQPGLPMSPTDPGSIESNRMAHNGPMPSLPGAGQGGAQGYSSNSGGGYTAGNFAPKVYGNYGGASIQTTANQANVAPLASNYMANVYQQANISNYGVQPNPMLNPVTGGSQKPFSDYQRPSGYSPWMGLYSTPTNNGTVNPYYSTVQPNMQQQQYNHAVAEQIQGVRNYLVSPQGGGTPGTEVPVGGAGMANPNGYINYANPMPNH